MNDKTRSYFLKLASDILTRCQENESDYDRSFRSFVATLNGNDFPDYLDNNAFNIRDIKFHFAAGVSKAVIVLKDEDYVLKIPFTISTEDEEIEDYCNLEVENYRAAESTGVSHFFAKEEFLFTYHYRTQFHWYEVPVYIQEKVTPYREARNEYDSLPAEKKVTSISPKHKIIRKISSKMNSHVDTYDYSADVCAPLRYAYEDDDAKVLDKFLSDCDINDIHGGNIGVNEYGMVVIYDYSGYHGGEERYDSYCHDSDYETENESGREVMESEVA